MIYLDHNATAPLDPRVRHAMSEWLARGDVYGNPSSVHRVGQRARASLELDRRKLAQAIGAEPLSITFTSGGTEANNLAILGALRWRFRKGLPSAFMTTAIEHSSVLGPASQLTQDGHEVMWLPTDSQGRIDLTQLVEHVKKSANLGLLSLSAANHELGNTYEITELVRAVREVRPDVWIHSDAVQAFGKIAVDFSQWDVDLMTISAHKLGGPQGVGALVHRRGVEFEALWSGGGQERGRRTGTEAALLIHGFAVAAELARAEQPERYIHGQALHQGLLEGLRELPGAVIHGDQSRHLASTIMVTFGQLDGQMLLANLDLAGVAVSNGSACTSGLLEPSRVLLSLGVPRDCARSGLRLSFGSTNTLAEIEHVVAILPEILRRMKL